MRWDIVESVLGRWSRSTGAAYKIVIGLGNPGGQYAETRHNVGFWCVDRLARESAIDFTRRRRHMVIGEGRLAGHPVALAKPRTFVNRSGQAATSLLGLYRAPPTDLVVVYDDMDLPVGRLRVRSRGSAGGHNGMRSIIEAVGTGDFTRVRIGIGRPPSGKDEVDYVLGTISPEERGRVEGAVERGAQAVVCILAEGVEVAMERFNSSVD